MSLNPALAKTVTALLAASGLWALIYFYEYKGEAGRIEAREAESRVFSFDEDSISGVEIATSGSDLTLRKEGANWEIVEPVEARADGDKVASMLSAAARLRVEERLEDVPESELEGFALRDPSTRLTLKSADVEYELSVGDKVPVGDGYYAMKAGDPAVLVVSGGMESVTSASLESLRFKKIVGVDLWQLSGFTLSGKGSDLHLTRQGQDWRIEEPVSFPADAAKIRELWSGLSWLEAGRVALDKPAPEDLTRMGLEPPVLRLSLETEENAFSVDFGATDESGGAVFVKRSDLNAVMTVPEGTLDRLEAAHTAVNDLRDRRLAVIDRERLRRVEISGPVFPLVLVKSEDGSWTREGDGGSRPPDVDSLLDAVEELRADGFEEAVPAESAEIVMTLTEKGAGEDAEEATTTIRLLVDPEGAADRRMLSTVAPSTLYRVPAMSVQTLIDRIAPDGVEANDEEPGESE